MRRVVLLVPLLAVACSAGSSGGHPRQSAPPVDRASVTAAMTRSAAGAHVLVHIARNGGLDATLARYGLASSDFRRAADLLDPPPRGLPAGLARRTAGDLRSVADGLDALATCFRSSVAPDSCNDPAKVVGPETRRAGNDMTLLLPYSSMTMERLQRLES